MKDLLKSPSCEVITIGSELLLGQIIDTNTTYLSKAMGRIGVTIRFRTAVGDRLDDIEQVINQAVGRCDMVLTTGGLGPTRDDLTREAVAGVGGVDLTFRQDLMKQIEGFFKRIGYRMPENNRRQAYIPEGSQAIYNPVGTAPAFISEVRGKPVIALPGVPRELKFLLKEEILPWLRNRYELHEHRVTYRVLKAIGLGESAVDRLIGDLMGTGKNPEVGLLASPGEIKIRITAAAESEENARALIRPVEMEIRSRLKEKILGADDDTLEGVIHEMLKNRAFTLSILETFTIGMAAQRLYAISSKHLKQSFVISDRDALNRWAGKNHTQPGEALVRRVAQRVRDEGKSDMALVILGFVEEKEKGFAVRGDAFVTSNGVEKRFSWEMGGDLETLRQRGAIIGLNTLRLALLE